MHFDWQRPAVSLCPSRATLQADVEALMGREVFSARSGARVFVRGSVDDGPRGVTVQLEAADRSGTPFGTRELSAPAGRCASLRDAIVLVLTLFIEHQTPPVDELDIRFGFGAAASLAQTPMPRLAVGLGPALLLALGPVLRLHARAAYWPPVSIQTARGIGTTLEAASLDLRGCARIWAGLGLCGGFEGGALWAIPLQLRGPERQVRLLALGSLAASWELLLGERLRAEIAAGALLAFSRPAFSYLRADGERMAVYRPPALGANLLASFIILSD